MNTKVVVTIIPLKLLFSYQDGYIALGCGQLQIRH